MSVRFVDEVHRVGDSRNADHTSIALRELRSAHEGRVAAVAPSNDTSSSWIGDAFGNQALNAMIDVGDRAFPLSIGSGTRPGSAVSTGSTVVSLEDHVALGGEELRKPVEAPVIARATSSPRKPEKIQVLDFH